MLQYEKLPRVKERIRVVSDDKSIIIAVLNCTIHSWFKPWNFMVNSISKESNTGASNTLMFTKKHDG